MPWYKLEGTHAQTASTLAVELMEAFQRAFMSNRGPRDMAMFSGFNYERGAPDYYFTPATQEYASELLYSIGAIPCEPPSLTVSLIAGHQEAIPRFPHVEVLDQKQPDRFAQLCAMSAKEINQDAKEVLMSVEDYKDKIGIPDTHKLVILNCTSWEKGGRDTGYCIVEQRDSKGRPVAQFGVIDERETFPPRERTIHYSRI